MIKKKDAGPWLKFLGTAGARFVMIKQLRASGGLWIHAEGENILVDPGPGSLVRCAMSKPKLDPTSLSAIVLTHRHLDHVNDVNVMIEAMTEGGFKKRGVVFLPEDALGEDAVVLKHARSYIARLEILKSESVYQAGTFSFSTSMQLKHPSQTYGLKFKIKDQTISLLSDTAYFEGLESFFDTDILIINVVLAESRPGVAHLSLEDVKNILSKIRPRKVILTHFGMSLLRLKPHVMAQKLAWETGLNIVAAVDGMSVAL